MTTTEPHSNLCHNKSWCLCVTVYSTDCESAPDTTAKGYSHASPCVTIVTFASLYLRTDVLTTDVATHGASSSIDDLRRGRDAVKDSRRQEIEADLTGRRAGNFTSSVPANVNVRCHAGSTKSVCCSVNRSAA